MAILIIRIVFTRNLLAVEIFFYISFCWRSPCFVLHSITLNLIYSAFYPWIFNWFSFNRPDFFIHLNFESLNSSFLTFLPSYSLMELFYGSYWFILQEGNTLTLIEVNNGVFQGCFFSSFFMRVTYSRSLKLTKEFFKDISCLHSCLV